MMKFTMQGDELRIENETGGYIMRWDWYERSWYYFNLNNEYDSMGSIKWLVDTEFTSIEHVLWRYFNDLFLAKYRDWWKNEIYND